MKKKIDLYLENLYLIKNMFEDDPIALPAIEELIEKAEHCKKRSNIELILTAIIIIFFIIIMKYLCNGLILSIYSG